MHNTPAYIPEKDADKIIEALRICASADEDACQKCHYGATPGSNCCDQLLSDAADVLESRNQTATEAATV